MEPRVKRRQTRGEWGKKLKIHRGLLFVGVDENKNENIKNCTTVGQLHYAIYLMFDILIPKSRIMQTQREACLLA